MGGKTWSEEEERVFWKQLIPYTHKRLGNNPMQWGEQSWQWVADQMTQIMGNKARRQYTYLCISEHYFQNASQGHFSPNVGKMCKRYYKFEQRLKKERVETQKKLEALKKAEQTKNDKKAKLRKEEDADDKAAINILSDVEAKDESDNEVKTEVKEETKVEVKEEGDNILAQLPAAPKGEAQTEPEPATSTPPSTTTGGSGTIESFPAQSATNPNPKTNTTHPKPAPGPTTSTITAVPTPARPAKKLNLLDAQIAVPSGTSTAQTLGHCRDPIPLDDAFSTNPRPQYYYPPTPASGALPATTSYASYPSATRGIDTETEYSAAAVPAPPGMTTLYPRLGQQEWAIAGGYPYYYYHQYEGQGLGQSKRRRYEDGDDEKEDEEREDKERMFGSGVKRARYEAYDGYYYRYGRGGY